MNAQLRSLLEYGSYLLLVAGTVGVCACTATSPSLLTRVRDYELHLDRLLHYLQWPFPARRIWRIQVVSVASLCALAAAAETGWPLLLATIAAAAPRWWVARAARRRTVRVEAQLDTWMVALANLLRSNPALPAAIAASAQLVAAPLSRELARVTSEQRLGVALDHALRHMAERVASPAAFAALATLRVARATGGDISHTLEAAAASLREMARLEGVVRTKTAEGRAQTVVIAGAPLLLVALLDELDPQLLTPLWTSTLGRLIAAAAVALWATAIALARRITAVDV